MEAFIESNRAPLSPVSPMKASINGPAQTPGRVAAHGCAVASIFLAAAERTLSDSGAASWRHIGRARSELPPLIALPPFTQKRTRTFREVHNSVFKAFPVTTACIPPLPVRELVSRLYNP